MHPTTLFEKIWNEHVVVEPDDENKPYLIYIDLHLVHEVTSPQAFESLRLKNRKVRRPDLTFAVVDHNIPTDDRREILEKLEIPDEIMDSYERLSLDGYDVDLNSLKQMKLLMRNAREFGIRFFGVTSPYQGIVHVIGPQLGLTQPGMTIVCGDSHTSTHGAMGAVAFGIGTSEVEHVLATQTLWVRKPKQMRISVEGVLQKGVDAKDVILYITGRIGTTGSRGYAVEYSGNIIRDFSIEERMTVCNMTVESGARTAIVAPDEKTFKYLEGKPFAPKDFDKAVEHWRTLRSDPDARYDAELYFDISDMEPQVTWGTRPSDVIPISGKVPDPEDFDDPVEREHVKRALKYMGLSPGTEIRSVKIDRVFIGSCTNGRLEDLVKAAKIVKGRKIAPWVRAIVVPGSQLVKAQAEKLGLDKIFKEAGFEWRNAGCSMCLGMNPDILAPGERCVSTSNRNYEGRQGRDGRTHLASPMTAAASAVKGYISDPREFL